MKPKKKFTPFIKWAGGKEKELVYILSNMPNEFERYIEPFVGSGAVYFAINAKDMLINDKSKELINLYNMIREDNSEFYEKIESIYYNWKLLENVIQNYSKLFLSEYKQFSNNEITKNNFDDFIINFLRHNVEEFNKILLPSFNIALDNFMKEITKNLIEKTNRMKKIEKEKGKLSDEDILKNIETSFKSAYYMHFRYLYNNYEKLNISLPFHSAIFYFIREYCYASMFRYNKKGEFNVPYGGISYNRKDFSKKIDYIKNKELKAYLQKTKLYNLDFEEFLKKVKPTKDDFIFLDPPYDTKFSDYAGMKFTSNDQIRLAKYLYKTNAKFMLVIKNTKLIKDLYFNKGFNIKSFDKKYLVSFQNRNNKEAEHLLITN